MNPSRYISAPIHILTQPAMNKLIVSSADVALVVDRLPVDSISPTRLPRVPSWTARILLAPSVLLLPLLSLATVIVWLAVRRKEPRLRHGWIQFCCLLLVISAIGSSFAAGFAIFILLAPSRGPAMPFALSVEGAPSVTAATAPLSTRELASRMEGAVFIVTRDSRWLKPSRAALALSAFGTGVLLSAGDRGCLFATCRHVLDGENWQRAAPYTGEALLWDHQGGIARAQIVGRHKDLDMMLLRMPLPPGKPLFTQPVIDFAQIAPGERIMTFGHPEGLFFSLADGIISRKDPNGQIQITAPVSPGSSGGPVYNMYGQLLGLVSSMLNKRDNPHSENLNFAVRADCLLHTDQWHFVEPVGLAALEQFSASARVIAPAPPLSPSPIP